MKKKKKKDFTPEYVQETVFDYITEVDFPDDELSEIGSRVRIADFSNVELNSVKESGTSFIVDGNGTVETSTDTGEGDSLSGSYPMKFVYEYDEDGKIINQVKRHIDTSRFFAGNEDL